MKILLETDQRNCFDDQGKIIVCQDTNQDASLKYDKTSISNRFKVYFNGVKDCKTGLTWHRNANPFDFPLNWNEAYEYILSMNANIKESIHWRLPTRTELFSLISHQEINPSLLEGHPFENVFNGYYWTQTECARLSDQAWYIHLGGGRVYRGMKHGSYMVWPVAGPKMESYFSDNRFKKDGNFIFDSITNRTWFVGIEMNQTAVTWKEALNSIKSLNDNKTAGFIDWRLPNIRELDSLVDTSRHSPAFFKDYSFERIQEGYWSSTTSLYEPRYAWVLYTRDGAIGVGFKPKANFFVLPVR